jgi:hypothetical protein
MSVQIAVSVMLKSATVLFFLIVFVAWSGAGAETLIPNSVEYTVEIKHEKSAASYTIMVTILNYPISPEALNFRAGVWQGKVQDDQFESLTGFTLDVGNLQFKNGLIIGTQKTPIADAAFGSKTFNSLGRLYAMDMEDGGRGAMTVDMGTALDFLKAVWGGDFDIAFNAKSLPLERSYHILAGPPPSIIRQFKDCLDTLR